MKTLSATGPSLGPVIWKLSPGCCGEAVQVQAVVPVGAADEGQAVGAEMGAGVAGSCGAGAPSAGCALLSSLSKATDSSRMLPVARLAQISGGARDEPQRVIVEAGADVPVALFGQGLVLVVGAAVRKLGGGNVQDTAPGRGSGIMCTKPSRSWQLNPGSPCRGRCRSRNSWRERLMLNVTMHWYWFQMLTIRSSFSSPESSCQPESRSVPVIVSAPGGPRPPGRRWRSGPSWPGRGSC